MSASQLQGQPNSNIPVINYEGSGYETDFWVGQGRDYEDAAERLALKQLIPPQGGRIAEIGAGFGRLVELYQGYEQIVLFDYSRSLLQNAAKRLGTDKRIVFVAGNIYEMPLADGVLDTLVMVRVMHHLADVPRALAQLKRLLHQDSVAILEYANKRNLKSILRWMVRKQEWSPWQQQPLEFVALNFDFHPSWMDKRFTEADLQKQEQFAVSHFRLPILKKALSPNTLAKMDSRLFRAGGFFPLAPSVFAKLNQSSGSARRETTYDAASIADLFCCPRCNKEAFILDDEELLVCQECNTRYGCKEGVWDFKESTQ